MRAIVIVISLLGLPLPLRAAVYQKLFKRGNTGYALSGKYSNKENISSQRTSSHPV